MDSINLTDKEQKQIRDAIDQCCSAMVALELTKQDIKDIKSVIKEEFKGRISPKLFNKMVQTAYKQNYGEVKETNQQFEILFESVMTGKVS